MHLKYLLKIVHTLVAFFYCLINEYFGYLKYSLFFFVASKNIHNSSWSTIYLHIFLFSTIMKMPHKLFKTILQGTIDGVGAQNNLWAFFSLVQTHLNGKYFEDN